MEIKELTPDNFWPLFKQHRSALFQDTIYYNCTDVWTDHEKVSFEELKKGMESRKEIFLGAYEGDEFIGWSASCQSGHNELYMMNSAIFEAYRRKGIYSALVNETLHWAKERGFQTVYSRHVCSNNAVIIPKLKRGFLISGLEVTDDFGALVRLTYFLNETRRKGFNFRTGLSDSPEARKAFKL